MKLRFWSYFIFKAQSHTSAGLSAVETWIQWGSICGVKWH